MDPLLSFFPASLAITTAALAAAVVAVCLDSRLSRTVLATMVTALLLLQLHMVAPSLMPSGGTGMALQAAGTARAPAPARLVTVMALNVGTEGVDSTTLLTEVRARKVDILALPELQPLGLEALEDAGLAAVFPYRAVDVDWAGVGSSIFSRYPLQVSGRVRGSSFYQSRAVVSVPGVAGGIHLTAVHVASPRPGHIPNWRQELQQLGDLRRDLPGSSPAILLGDFNASHDHREFRELVATGLTDAAQASGKGLAPTWPAGLRVPPFVALDHVLVTPDIRVLDFATVAVAGTDHAGVVAELVLAE
ncbi:endonuclease/exonuclease/phosphatase family protein [Pseudarthrobacter sulfonivorans]|uniref:endonuclease/exonuclease/phosphatase family protein n=1 Tax=Pseudarthrobacter sulfonivorans TaxID=121292 RepID=UPI0028617A34|nr:endonuclease/exonuclease/phosphatase family protein [Pseudarthrobacter sulfonivorans]MDR6417434.1 endonuclease/exonuclease/phosphatase (EEP) superfamily protein YafD [Pseudarthrobacter sulfonivorans]